MKIFNNSTGTADVIIDSHGWWSTSTGAAGGSFKPLNPARIIDTRTGVGTPQAQIPALGTVTLTVTGVGGVGAAADVSSVAVNMTVVNATGPGAVIAYSADVAQVPLTGNQAFNAGEPIAAFAIVKTGESSGQIKVTNLSTTAIDIIFDVFGYHSKAAVGTQAAYVAYNAPYRWLDTRDGTGLPQADLVAGTTTLTPGSFFAGYAAISVTITVVNATAPGWIALYKGVSGKTAANATTSNINFNAGEAIANTAILETDTFGRLDIVIAGGNADVIVDVNGHYFAETANITYKYGPDGLRRSKTGAPCCLLTSGITTYTWSGAGGMPSLLKERTASSWGPGNTFYVYGPGGLPVSQFTDSGTSYTYYHHDQLGSTRAVTNEAGSTLDTLTYDPFGAIDEQSWSLYQPRFGYAGQYTDRDTGLIYMRARYYDPETGQFMSRDPLNAMTRSAYGYVYNSPLNASDPSGLWSFNIPGTDLCLGGAGDDGCDTIKEQHPEVTQHVANFSGGVVNGLSLGNADAVLGSDANKVEWDSGWAGIGTATGYALLIPFTRGAGAGGAGASTASKVKMLGGFGGYGIGMDLVGFGSCLAGDSPFGSCAQQLAADGVLNLLTGLAGMGPAKSAIMKECNADTLGLIGDLYLTMTFQNGN